MNLSLSEREQDAICRRYVVQCQLPPLPLLLYIHRLVGVPLLKIVVNLCLSGGRDLLPKLLRLSPAVELSIDRSAYPRERQECLSCKDTLIGVAQDRRFIPQRLPCLFPSHIAPLPLFSTPRTGHVPLPPAFPFPSPKSPRFRFLRVDDIFRIRRG